MKHAAQLPMLICLFFFLPLFVYCQYQPFDLNVAYHFENADITNQQLTVRIERIIDEVDHRSFIPFRMAQDDTVSCVRPNRHHWLGDRINVYPDGRHVFVVPYLGDIELQSFANLGTRWRAANFSDTYVEVGFESLSVEMVQGTLDTIKTYEFYHFDAVGSLLLDDLTGSQIKLSKNNGYVTLLDFGAIAEAGHFLDIDFGEFNISEYENLRFAEVNDFDIGDEFHIYEEQFRFGYYSTLKLYTQLTVLSKIENDSQYIYQMAREERRELGEMLLDTVFIEEIQDVIVKTYPKNLDFFDEIALVSFIDDSLAIKYNISKQTEFGRQKTYGYYENAILPGDSCLGFFVYRGLDSNYIDGKGGPYYRGDVPNGYDIRELMYFKNDSIEIGSSLDSVFTAVNRPAVDPALSAFAIYPNPIVDNFTVEWSENYKPIQLEVHDVWGRIYRKLKIKEGQTNLYLDGTDFLPGMYVAVLIDENSEKITAQFIVK